MQSPFPGMDPYIEACGLWEDFHTHLIANISDTLAEAAPAHYLVRAGERSYVVLVDSEKKARHAFLPDIGATASRNRKRGSARKGGATVAEQHAQSAVSMRAFIEETYRETFVEIYTASPQQQLITCIEVLSPTNKRPGTPGWDVYQRKRQGLILGGVNLVEVDLLRGGQRMPMVDRWPDAPFTLLVARAYQEQNCQVWSATLRERLPPIPVPLRKPDPDVVLDLQPMVETIYRRFRYARSIDYHRPLMPPLGTADATWFQRRLTARSRGRQTPT